MRVRCVVGAVIVLMAALAGCADNRVRTNDASRSPTTDRGRASTDPHTTAADGTASAGSAVDDNARVGSAGSALLSAQSPSVAVEVDRSPRAQLNVDPHSVLGEELRKHGRKRKVTAGSDGAVPAQDVYTADGVREISATAGQARSDKDRPSVYVLSLEGRYEDENVTGVAFAATSFAVFPDQIHGGLLGMNAEDFETAVLVHELGHLFGLVNLTGKGAVHEEPEHIVGTRTCRHLWACRVEMRPPLTRWLPSKARMTA